MRIAIAAIAVLLAVETAKAEPVNQAGTAVIGGATYVATAGVQASGLILKAGWDIATFPLQLFAPQPRYVTKPVGKGRRSKS